MSDIPSGAILPALATHGPDAASPFTVHRIQDDGKPQQVVCMGLTKREHFAALALQGILAADQNDMLKASDVAHLSVECADALIAALNNK